MDNDLRTFPGLSTSGPAADGRQWAVNTEAMPEGGDGTSAGSQRGQVGEPPGAAFRGVLQLPPDEHGLDAVLLELLAPSREAIAEVFVERSARLSAGISVSRDDLTSHAPVLRTDAGVASRVVTPSGVRARHSSGLTAESLARLRDVAPDRAAGRVRPASGSATPSTPVAREEGGALDLAASTAELIERFRGRAERAIAGRPEVTRVEIEVERFLRCVHVVSSEWGHASDERLWNRIVVVATSASGARARRGLGSAPWPDGDDAERLAEQLVGEAVDAASVRAEAEPLDLAPRAVVLSGAAGGVLIHEAVGHALEADAWERGSSIFSARLGERVASGGLTVVDDPTLRERAGGARIDDEGVPAAAAVLVEDGVLRTVLADGLRTAFRPGRTVGRGRRATYRDLPLPRMTNTHVAAGDRSPEELVHEVDDGLLVTRLERAAMDPLTGDFRFRVTEGFRIEGGRTTSALSEVFLLGNAALVLGSLDGIGSEIEWDDGCGTCGREGQWVPVAVGGPRLRVARGALSLG